jgi:hypothetical protein
MIPVKHIRCGKTAFYLTKPLKINDQITTEVIRFSNSKSPEVNSLLICEHCKYTGFTRLNNREYSFG